MTIKTPDGNNSVANVAMLIDTGAEATLIPRSVVEALGIIPTAERISLQASDGALIQAETAGIHVVFLGKVFRGNHLLIDDKVGILGRNILQHVRLRLDGPASQWDEWR